MPIEPCEETQLANRRDVARTLYGSLDGKVVAHGNAGNAIAARMGTGEAHGDALAWLARCPVALRRRHAGRASRERLRLI